MNNKPFPLLIALILLFSMVACSNTSQSPSEAAKAEDSATTGASPVVVEIREGGSPVRVVPEAIEVKAGDTVIFRFSGLDDQTHTFTANSLGIDLEVAGGQVQESPPVTFSQIGTAFFFCRFHRALGGAGSIKVTN